MATKSPAIFFKTVLQSRDSPNGAVQTAHLGVAVIEAQKELQQAGRVAFGRLHVSAKPHPRGGPLGARGTGKRPLVLPWLATCNPSQDDKQGQSCCTCFRFSCLCCLPISQRTSPVGHGSSSCLRSTVTHMLKRLHHTCWLETCILCSMVFPQRPLRENERRNGLGIRRKIRCGEDRSGCGRKWEREKMGIMKKRKLWS